MLARVKLPGLFDGKNNFGTCEGTEVPLCRSKCLCSGCRAGVPSIKAGDIRQAGSRDESKCSRSSPSPVELPELGQNPSVTFFKRKS